MWKKMKNKLCAFYHDEDGSELMQWAIIIIIVAALAGVAYFMSDTLKEKLNKANQDLQNIGN